MKQQKYNYTNAVFVCKNLKNSVLRCFASRDEKTAHILYAFFLNERIFLAARRLIFLFLSFLLAYGFGFKIYFYARGPL